MIRYAGSKLKRAAFRKQSFMHTKQNGKSGLGKYLRQPSQHWFAQQLGIGRLISTAAALSLVGGCTYSPGHLIFSHPDSARATPAQALPAPPDGRAALYTMRHSGMVGAAVPWNVMIDGDDTGGLANGHYFRDLLRPGPHYLGYKSGKCQFTAEAGKSYFFEISAGLVHPKFTSVSETDGRRLLDRLEYDPLQAADVELVQQNWGRLKVGMNLDEVRRLIGPFPNRQTTGMAGQIGPGGASLTFAMHLRLGRLTLTFKDGNLSRWDPLVVIFSLSTLRLPERLDVPKPSFKYTR